MLVLAGAALPRPTVAEQIMCADCDVLKEQLRIVDRKLAYTNDGLEMVQQARTEFDRNADLADGFATAYVVLQGVNISFGLAVLPCGIPASWLKGVMASTGAASAVLHGEGAGKTTLATGLGYLGLGVVGDTLSAGEFLREWSASGRELKGLGKLIDRQADELDAIRRGLAAERERLQHDVAKAGCKDDLLEFLDLEESSS